MNRISSLILNGAKGTGIKSLIMKKKTVKNVSVNKLALALLSFRTFSNAKLKLISLTFVTTTNLHVINNVKQKAANNCNSKIKQNK